MSTVLIMDAYFNFEIIYIIHTLIINIFGRHLLGEDLGKFVAKELDQLECVLDTSLKRIRSKQVYIIYIYVVAIFYYYYFLPQSLFYT